METIRIHCTNNGKYYEVPKGTTVRELALEICRMEDGQVLSCKGGEIRFASGPESAGSPVLAALVNHQLKDMGAGLMLPDEVEFIGYSHPDGRRTYIRSLFFVLQKAVRELYPEQTLIVDYALPSGHYCEIREKTPLEDGRPMVHPLDENDLKAIKARMHEIISEDIPIVKRKLQSDRAAEIFEANGQHDKAQLIRSLGRYNSSVYFIGGTADSFHGPLVYSTGYLKTFAISGFKNGFCLQYPMEGSSKIAPMKKQAKIAATLKEHSDWCSIIGVKGIGSLNRAIQDGKAVELINLSEARHERRYAEIADKIWQKRDKVKIVFIAGPSSSGKTSTSLRLALQCKVLGMNPKVIELDNYFVNREDTPKDENGEYDFEALEAMDLKLLNSQLNDLLAGKEVEIPKFNFKAGQREKGKAMKLEEKDILIMEGIHALNPAMTSAVDDSRIFRVYASALTSLSVDENNNISTSDNRLLRRIVRDNRVRGITPEDTILRWHSVRRGENRNIFPFQENADAEFNSALMFELPMLKYYAEPLLRRIPPYSEAYTEATRMLKFLDYIVALSPDEIAAIPPTSIMREFIGGQTL
ncbi:MAG: nucleoside kinase [Bacteroidales bacterium]|nr:nucleoside kinase [Bacteroides sp.]MCM1503186.1 nucleoside kinase [Bacteroidales bacterium]